MPRINPGNDGLASSAGRTRRQPASSPRIGSAEDPVAERRRVAALRAYAIVDTDREPVYDAFASLAASICGTPIGSVAFIDESRLWRKAVAGLPARTTLDRERTFCDLAIRSDGILEIADTRLDSRASARVTATGGPSIRFYAGAPLVDRWGNAIGTLCALDVRPRRLDTEQRTALERAAASLVALVQSRAGAAPPDLERLALLGGAVESVAEPLAIVRAHGNTADDDVRLEYANRAFAELFACDAGRMAGSAAAAFFGPRTDLAKVRRLRRTLGAGDTAVERVVLYARDGTPRVVDVRARDLDASHRAVSFRDVTSSQATLEAVGTLNERLASFVTNHSDPILTLDALGICTGANAAAAAVFGLARERLVGFGFLTVAEAGLFPGGEPFPKALARGTVVEFRAAYRTGDGATLACEVKAIPIVAGGRSDGAYVVIRDVTEHERLASLVAERSRRTQSLYLIATSSTEDDARITAALRLMTDALGMEGAYVAAIEGDGVRILDVVGDLAHYLGNHYPLSSTYARETLASRDVTFVNDLLAVDRSDRHRLAQEWRGFIAAPLTVDGRDYGAIGCVTRSPKTFDDDDVSFIRLAATLISTTIERQSIHRRLSDLAYTDALTGLGNRARLLHEIDAAIGRAARRERAFAVHFVDLDGFKVVNDRLGHAAGDAVLVETARRLGEITRISDEISRLGGDEFVILQPEIDDAADALALGRRIVARLSEPFAIGGDRIEISASVGIARYPANGIETGTLLECADAALYRAKAEGKRCAITSDVASHASRAGAPATERSAAQRFGQRSERSAASTSSDGASATSA